ncbi:hypothetical protein BD413DRAFT_239933 [Trametes elegans]|nr:hypothetical protein BD413DRAFT_239933 [Trametes elegans]
MPCTVTHHWYPSRLDARTRTRDPGTHIHPEGRERVIQWCALQRFPRVAVPCDRPPPQLTRQHLSTRFSSTQPDTDTHLRIQQRFRSRARPQSDAARSAGMAAPSLHPQVVKLRQTDKSRPPTYRTRTDKRSYAHPSPTVPPQRDVRPTSAGSRGTA